MSQTRSGRRRGLAAGVAAAAVALTFSATTPVQAADKGPIIVATMHDLVGPAVVSHRASESGIETAVSEVNAAGGINGRKLQVKIYDGGNNPNISAAAYRQLVNDRPTFVAGVLNAATMASVTPFALSSKIPWMYTGTLYKEIDVPHIFSATISPDNNGRLLYQSVKQMLGGKSMSGKKIAIELVAPAAAQDAKLAAFKAIAKKDGAALVRTYRDPATLSDWSSQAASIVAAGVDAVVLSNVDAPVVTMGKALAVAGYRGLIVGDQLATAETTFSTLNNPKFFAIRDGNPPVAGSSLYNAIVKAKASTTRGLANTSLFQRGYLGVWSAARALQKCGDPCPSDKFTQALRSLGDLNIPMSPAFGPLNYSKSQSGVHSAQLYVYDPTTKKAKSSGPVITVKD